MRLGPVVVSLCTGSLVGEKLCKPSAERNKVAPYPPLLKVACLKRLGVQ